MQLIVKSFSCVQHADIDFKRLTILVGPQASGKSVLAKLNCFFTAMTYMAVPQIVRLAEYTDYVKNVKSEFEKWFPAGTWGKEKFDIAFSAGGFRSHLFRRSYKDRPLSSFSLTICSEFEQLYEKTLEATKVKADKSNAADLSLNFSIQQEVDRALRAGLEQIFGADWTQFQMFVPAGRSFFTSVGKAIAAFEQSTILDPLVVTFGRAFASYTEMYRFNPSGDKRGPILWQRATEILGGEIVRERDSNYVRMADGRKIPFATLSSGQQELLPLLVVLTNFAIGWGNRRRMIYIEEPEAHLFPEAQSRLIELLSYVLNSTPQICMAITTHSPYVLAKFNNLIKAGEIGALNGKRGKVEEFVKHDRWLRAGDVAAFAICDGRTRNVTGEEGLIDADYLDSVSGAISSEFSRLLEIEFAGS